MQEVKDLNNIDPKLKTREVKRIGITLGRVLKLNVSALKFLVLQMNCLQSTFEFEFLPTYPRFEIEFLPGKYEFLPTELLDDFCNKLSSKDLIDSNEIRSIAPEFVENYRAFLQGEVGTYKIRESLPDHIVLITLARFSNDYYTMRSKKLSILALGNWERNMAPPSILEFILTFILREAVAIVSRSLRGSIHIGTKGCLLDFNLFLDEARYKVLQGFICNYCRKALIQDDFPELADELILVLGKGWLGKSNDPNSPAGIVLNLGHDLFLTKGLSPTIRENFRAWLQKDGVPEFLKLFGTVLAGIIVAIILLWLGIKGE